MSTARPGSKRTHPHHDAPEAAADFDRLADLPPGLEREALRDRLIEMWLPMARRLAGKYRNRGETLDDLEQVASLGLFKAVDRYDPAVGTRFESFAIPTIVGELKRHFRDNTWDLHVWDLHVPRRIQDLRNRVRNSVRELSGTADDRSPAVALIAEHSGLSHEDVHLGLEAAGTYTSLSLDAPTSSGDGDGYALVDTLGVPEPAFERVVHREAVKPRIRRLPEREQRILYLRFFCDQTQSHIAEQLGLSQMHVSRLLNSTCQQLRQDIDTDREPTPA